MNNKELAYQLCDLWEKLDKKAMERKASHEALLELRKAFSGWDQKTQRAARPVIAEWLRSENPRKRFDALALVEEFSICEAISPLRELIRKLDQESTAESKFNLKRATEVLRKLAGDRVSPC